MPSSADRDPPYELPGQFYLGKEYGPDQTVLAGNYLLYESRDLTTHAVCVGMTGSGKTGLCLSLIEEAAIDHVPVIAIDPKGDLSNLLLPVQPEYTAAQFEPWIDPQEAARQQKTVAELAESTAQSWVQGLKQWDQSPQRLKRLRDAAEFTIYTPGSTAGRPLSMLRSFQAPSIEERQDAEAFFERIAATASGVLALLGETADPLTSRDHILLANLFKEAWEKGRDLTLEGLIQDVQKPPMKRVGILDLDTFYPETDRFTLAVRLNNLLASPSFSAWMAGDPIEIDRLLATPDGKPRVSILSIAHLRDNERMAFVTILLNEVLSWVRRQRGTSSLRAILYMDEIFGFFPPVASPPSKQPMLTLLKQARAYGLGVMLATQNPVDLDYKGLANTGTWFLGRLQTERDKARVLDGLEGAAAVTGSRFERKRIDALLSGLGKRVFLLNNVHSGEPVLFQTRWALSYLRGPLTREQIQRLTALKAAESGPGMAEAAQASPEATQAAPEATPVTPPASSGGTSPAGANDSTPGGRPLLSPVIPEFFLPPLNLPAPGVGYHYIPCLIGSAIVHYVDKKAGIDQRVGLALQVKAIEPLGADLWTQAIAEMPKMPHLDDRPRDPASFAPLPADCAKPRSYASWKARLKEYLYHERPMELYCCATFKLYSWPGEAEADFQVRVNFKMREERDARVSSLRAKYRPRRDAIEAKLIKARENLAAEQAEAQTKTWDVAINVGGSILDSFLGRKTSRSRSRTSTAAREASRAVQQRTEAAQAAKPIESLTQQLHELEDEFRREARDLELEITQQALRVEPYPIKPRKTGIVVEEVVLAWSPRAEPKWDVADRRE